MTEEVLVVVGSKMDEESVWMVETAVAEVVMTEREDEEVTDVGEDDEDVVENDVEVRAMAPKTKAVNRGKETRVALWSKIEKKHRQNSHPIIHCPTSEGVSEVSERANE